MKTNKLFSMGMLLPLLAVWLYTGEAAGTIVKGPFTVETCPASCLTSYEKDGKYYLSSDVEYNKICVKTWNVPYGKTFDGYSCWIKLPGADDFTEFNCKGSLHGWILNLPVQHGYNEIEIRARAKDNKTKDIELSPPLNVGWYVKMHAEPPAPRIWMDGKVGAIPNPANGGACNPLTIPIRLENGSLIYYRVEGGPTEQAGPVSFPPSGARPDFVDYELQPGSRTSLAPGEEIRLSIWATNTDATKVDSKGKVLQTRTTTSPVQEWIVACPDANSTRVIIDEPRPSQDTYASRALLYFHAEGPNPNPRLFCSLNGAVPMQCLSPHPYEGLRAGEQVFRVYAENADGSAGPTTEYRWTVLAPAVEWIDVPADSTAQTAELSFAAVPGVDVRVTFRCRVDGGSFADCTSPLVLMNLAQGEYVVEVYGISTVGTGPTIQHSWEVLATGPSPGPGGTGPGGGLAGVGCSAAAGMPLGLLALASLWFATRRRKS